MSAIRPSRTPLFFVLIGFLLAPPSQAQDKKEASAQQTRELKLAGITIKGQLSESPSPAGLFGQLEENLRKTIARLDKAAEDDNIDGVLLKVGDLSIGRGRLAEMRAGIGRVRNSGKKVYAQLDSAMTGSYLLASACDEIVMPPSGMLILPGVRAELMFYKKLLDRLDVKGDFLHMGAYKGAAEPFTRESMSPEVEKNLTALIDDLYDQLISTIAEDRKLEAEDVRKLIDQALITPRQAKEAGLVDRIAYDDELEAALEKESQAEEFEIAKAYGKKKLDTDFSGPMGMLKLMQMMLGVEGGSGKTSKKKVAVVYAVGPIMTGKSSQGLFSGATMGADTIVAALRKADKDESVVAIVLRVDSPGGSALASDLIWREIEQIEKPVIASMGDVAASGGYYISMGADKIFAEAGTVTGSIGVVGGKLAAGGLFNKIGVTTDVISRGENSGIFSSDRPFSESERTAFRDMLEEVYRQFTTKAAAGRGMEVEALEKLAGGQVFTGRVAKENGLIDEVGTLKDAIAEARKMAKVEDDEKTDLMILPEPRTFFDELLGDGDDEVSLELPLGKAIPAGLRQPLADLETLHRVFQQPAATLMPYKLTIE